MKNRFKLIFLLSIFSIINLNIFAQILDDTDIYAEREGMIRSSIVSAKSSIEHYGYDMVFQRIEHYSNPNITKLKGTVTCYMVAEENLDTILLDMAESLVIDSIVYRGNLTNYLHSDNVLKIVLPASISIGTLDSVSISYEGHPGTSEAYDNGFHGVLSQNIPVIWTDSEPYYSRDWYPCKMTLDDKIDSVDLIISCPSQYRSASNGIIASDTIINGTRTTHWKHRYPVTSYLVAYAVTNYELLYDYSIMPNGDTLEIQNYVFPEDNNPPYDLPHSLLPDVLEFFNEYFIPYPYAAEKYGQAKWMGPGAMENQTITFTYHWGLSLLAHELAHHWFGNYITCGSWQDIWLNESFATFTEGMMHEEFYPELWKDWKKIKIEAITDYPGGSVFVYDTTYFGNIFNSRLTYKKGGIMINMLRWEIGEEDFFAGIRDYLNDPDLAYGFAISDDIISHWEVAADTNLGEFFSDWLYGEGYPIYELLYDQDVDNNIELIANQTASIASAGFFEMHIPVLFKGVDDDTLIVFHNLYNGQVFEFNPGFDVIGVEFDPEYILITKGSHVHRIRNLEGGRDIMVYPNPAKDELYISRSDARQIKSIRLLDLRGKVLKIFDEVDLSSSTISLNISNLKSGSYMLSTETEKGVFISKLIKI